MPDNKPHRVWNVAEAKTRLSEILRLAETEGPQYIGARKRFVVVPAKAWAERAAPGTQLGRWLIENTPRGTNLEIPDRHDGGRELPCSERRPRGSFDG